MEPPRADLTAYVPRIVVEWALSEPDALHRRLDGTMAFVDVSGFTAMSERLSAKGKAGAEEVTDVMNRTFAQLLDVAYARGGGLLKFGGDALLLFFSGEEHAACAARAAYDMRNTLREIGQLRTSTGQVTLRMHVGVHSGEFDFFLVGRSHRELLVTGPAATMTVEMEAASEAGEILVSRSTAALLDPRIIGEERGEGFLLRAQPDAAGELQPLPDTTGLDLAAFVPVGVRQHIATAAAEGEHRAAAIAFVRFGGVDALLANGKPDDAAAALSELVESVQAAAEEYDVCFLESDIDRDGGRIVLVAGAPVATENDEERILRTVRRIAETETRLHVQHGVNRGRVFAGEVGAPFRRTYTVLGDTAALAARLMARAERGQVLVPADVVARSQTVFAGTALPPFQVKGKAEPIEAIDLGPVVGVRTTADRPRLPMVDRERELAVLSAALGPARAGFGTLAELIGEPGIGKSRLVEEVRAQADDLSPVATSCEQYESTTPYFPFRELIRRLLDVPLGADPAENSAALRSRLETVAPELVPWIPLLGLALDAPVQPTPEVDDLQPAFRRVRLHGVVTTLLGSLLSSPTMILFEDVHWMDEASTELLRHIALQLQGKPWFACTTRRPVAGGFSAAEGTPPVPAFTIRLDPLPDEDARKLAVSAAPEGLAADELHAIAERAGGNPLFLQELVSARGTDPEQPEDLPDTVEALIGARIDRLSAPDRALLRWASVLGPTFASDVLELVLTGDPSAASDSEAWDRLTEFVERDPNVAGAYRFRHALFRDAAYEGLPYRRRRELHARVGEAYERLRADETEELAEVLSLHFLRAEVHDKAWSYSLVAAERARAKSANADAAEFYRRALDARKGVPELGHDAVADVWEALGDVSELSGQYEDAGHAYRQAARLAQAPGRQPALLLKQGIVREREGDYVGALRRYSNGRTAAEALPKGDEQTRHIVRLGLATAGVRLRQGKLTECIRWCREVVPTALAIEDLESAAHGYYLLHLSYTSLGWAERRDFRGIALPIYEELGDLLGQANVLNNLGIDAYYEGRWDDALGHYEQSRRLRERIGDVVGAATIVGNIAEILSDQGRTEEARELFEEAAAVFQAAHARFLEHVATGNLGRLAAREGRFNDAEQALEAALEGFGQLRAASFMLEAQARLAELDVLRGDRPERALERAEAALVEARASGGSPLEAGLLRLVGYARAQSGRTEEARASFEESLAAAQSTEAEYEQALAHQALAAVGEDADRNAARAQSLLDRLGVVSLPPIPLP
jgi:class 3 adenylate cyclase/tetratricopeptide (TPR) repeat protein